MNYEQKYNDLINRLREYRERFGNPLYKEIGEEFPELRESEDERIRKELIGYLTHRAEVTAFVNETKDCERWIAYLEKQKEPAHIPDKFSGLKSLMLQYLQSAANRKDDSEIESDTDLWGRKILDYVWKYDEKLKEQKPVEWSEGDSDNLERVDNYLWMLDDYVGDDCAMPQGKTDKIRGNIQEVLSPWLKSLPERFNLQSKQEWSEEDERNMNTLISVIETYYHEYDLVRDDYPINARELGNWLKSIRPDSYKKCNSHWKSSEKKVKPLKNVPPIESIMK